MAEIADFNIAADSNSGSAVNGFWSEGMAPSAVNNAARENLAQIKRWYLDVGGALETGGTADVVTIAPNGAYTATAIGDTFTARVQTAVNAGASLTVGSSGSAAILDALGSAIAGGALPQGFVARFVYTSGGWRVMNAYNFDNQGFVSLATGITTELTGTPGGSDKFLISDGENKFIRYSSLSAAIRSGLTGVFDLYDDVVTELTSVGFSDRLLVADISSGGQPNRWIKVSTLANVIGGRTPLYTVGSNGGWSNSDDVFSIPVTDLDGYEYITISTWLGTTATDLNVRTATILRTLIPVAATPDDTAPTIGSAAGTGNFEVFVGRNTAGTSLNIKPGGSANYGKIMGVWGGSF